MTRRETSLIYLLANGNEVEEYMLALLFLGVGLLLPASASGCGSVPDAKLAVVSGQITDPTGAVIPNAQVQLKSASGERTYKHADENGCYRFAAPPGEYRVLATSQGFRTASVSAHLSSEHAAVENLALHVGECSACVFVEGTGTFAACVTDVTGTPVATADVVLVPMDDSRNTALVTFRLDEWGCGLVQPLQGRYRVSVTAASYRVLRRTIQIKEKGDAPLTLRLVRRH